MSRAALLLVLLDFAAIGGLPLFFFRRDGRLSLRWWLTAWPFFACPLLLLGAAFRVLPLDLRYAGVLGGGQDLAAVVPAAGSLALLFLTLGTHRIPIALWHQEDDAPRHVVTWGAYRFVRHPFYVSFLLAFLASVLLFPHPAVLGLAAYQAVALNATAAREERVLAASEFGEEYQAYMARTGRFLPRGGRPS